MKKLFKNPLFYVNIFLLVLLILLSASINPNLTNLPSFAKKAIAAVASILGEGTANYVAAFTGANQIGNSIIYDTGSNIGIGKTNPSQKLDVVGNISASDLWIQTANKWASQLSPAVGSTVYKTAAGCGGGWVTDLATCTTAKCSDRYYYTCDRLCTGYSNPFTCSNIPLGRFLAP